MREAQAHRARAVASRQTVLVDFKPDYSFEV